DTLTFTSGLLPGFGGVFVGSPPNLTFIPDADGDDIPDGPPQVLLDGWGIQDRHETLNSFIWGPDGWMYGCHGVFTRSRVGKPGDEDDKRQFIDGGIWRYHPTRQKFEVFARGLSNPWGVDFNDHGQAFTTCCVIPHLFHIVQGGVYHKQSLPHVNPHIYDDIKTIRTHRHLSAHGGARIYLADTLPPEYRNRLFMCNIHEHAVLTDILTPKGSSFVGSHGDDFLPTNDLAWVGFSVEIGPEGGVYILDWHDTDVCGNTINFPNSGRIYRVMPKGSTPIEQPDIRSLSDAQLIDLQLHTNDWYVRQARLQLQSRAAAGKLNRALVHERLEALLKNAETEPKRLRALWSLYVTDGLNIERMRELLDHKDEHIRAWVIQFLCDDSQIHAFGRHDESNQAIVGADILKTFAEMAENDPSPIVRLYLSSAVGRLPFDARWPILEGLASHAQDKDDNNLPRMAWFGLEPMVQAHPEKALSLAVNGKLPRLQQFVARRLLSDDVPSEPLKRERSSPKQDPNWQWTIQRIAPGFTVEDVGELGVVNHSEFRNAKAIQTHPLDRDTPCRLVRNMKLPSEKTSALKLRVSHHPHGDWQLRVLVNDDVLDETIISSKTVSDDEWRDVSVDLSKYAGQSVRLTIENRANNWANEWAYWNRVQVVSE
ncbi:MAG: PVC-type heme-binding CxxCH protein, partial [Planctomycetota bacterium]